MSSLRYQHLLLGELQSSSLPQQVTGLLEVLHDQQEQVKRISEGPCQPYQSHVAHLHCSSRTKDELIGEHVPQEAEAVKDLLCKTQEASNFKLLMCISPFLHMCCTAFHKKAKRDHNASISLFSYTLKHKFRV